MSATAIGRRFDPLNVRIDPRIRLNSHNCEIPGSNPGHDIQPNNFSILSVELRLMRRDKHSFI
jgi:hypothetical protein